MDVSIVSVNFRSEDYLHRMVDSLFLHTKGCSFEVILVNNDLEPLKDASFAGQVQVIENGVNRGFAAACNQGIKNASGRYIVLMNPDVTFDSDSLTAMVRHLDQDMDVGIAGPRLIYPDGSPQASVRRFPGVLDQLFVLLKLPHVFGLRGPMRHYLHLDLDAEKTQDVDQVMGAYFMIRREVLDQVGWLDEGFFVWFEEVDLCKRAVDAGWKVRYYADVKATHVGGGSFAREATLTKQRIIRHSLRRYVRKHLGWRAYVIFVLLDPFFRALAVLAHLLKRR